MKTWKQIVIQEVAQEFQEIRQAYKQTIKTQRRNFVIELERVNGRLYEVETESLTLKNKVKILKPKNTYQTSAQPRSHQNPQRHHLILHQQKR